MLLVAFTAFCECVGDLEMGKVHKPNSTFAAVNCLVFEFYIVHIVLQILARDGENNDDEKWIGVIGDLAGCISIKRPKEVPILVKLRLSALLNYIGNMPKPTLAKSPML